ncbi:MAG: GHKL domain-containing protein [bacterium]|nr:GHKL domain-containing protein [bacterium]
MNIYKMSLLMTGVIESMMAFVLFNSLMKKRERLPKCVYVTGIFVLAIIIDISNYMFSSSIVNISVTILGTLLVSFLYNGKVIIRILSSVLSFLISSVSEVLILLLLSVLFGGNVDKLLENSILLLLGIAISKLLGILLAGIIGYRIKHNNELSDKNYLILFTVMFVIATIIITTFYRMLQNGVNEYLRNMIIICTMGLCATIAIIMYLYEETLRQQRLATEQQLAQRQLKNQIRHYKAVMSSQNQIKNLKHDLRNHMLAIAAKINKKEYSQSIDYINKMLKKTEVNKCDINTGNTVLDAILSAKKEEAKKKNIDFYTNLRIAEKLPIAEDDICIIFGNALDNAIEACEKVSLNPYVRVLLSYCDDSLVCKIENSCADTDCINSTTTKEDVKNHGIGKINMEAALKHYDSVFSIKQDKGKYILSIVFMGLDKV